MIIDKYQIIQENKYIILTSKIEIFNKFKEYEIKNIGYYENIEINEDYKKYFKRLLKIIVIDSRLDYEKLFDKFENSVIFLSKNFLQLKKEECRNIISSVLYNNTNLINVSDYNCKHNISKNITYIPTGFDTIDEALNDLQTGTLTLITGKTGQGKSTVVEMIQNSAIEKSITTLVIDGEHTRDKKIQNSYLKILGRYKEFVDKVQINKRSEKRVNEKGEQILKEWIKDKFYLYTSSCEEKKKTRKELFELIRNHVIFENVQLVIIDNIMSLNVIDNSSDKYENQKLFVEECQKLAKKFNVCVVLVAHPKKTSNDELDEYDVLGSSDIPNLCDSILVVSKSNEEDKMMDVDGYIYIRKNRDYSEFPKVKTKYIPEYKTLYEIKNNNIDMKSYSRLKKIIKNNGYDIEFKKPTSLKQKVQQKYMNLGIK